MSSLETLVASILDGLSPVLHAALRPHLANAVALTVPDVVRIATRIALLREELGALEVDLQRALRAPPPEPAKAPVPALDVTKGRILEGLRKQPGVAMRLMDIKALVPGQNTFPALQALLGEGVIQKPVHGQYMVEGPPGATPVLVRTKADPRPKGAPPVTLKSRILQLLEQRRGKAVPYKKVAVLLRAPEKTVHATLSNIVSEGLAYRPAAGRYRALDEPASARGAAATTPPARGAGRAGKKAPSLYEIVFVEVGRRGAEPFRVQDVVDAIGGKPATVRTFLERMVARGALRKVSTGRYASSFARATAANPGKEPTGPRRKAKRAGTKSRPAPQAKKASRRARKTALRPAPGQSIGDRTLALLAKGPAPMSGRDIAEALGSDVRSVFAELSKLAARGRIQRIAKGLYAPSGATDVPPASVTKRRLEDRPARGSSPSLE